MRNPSLARAIEAAGGVRALARRLGVSQPAISMWTRIPADRVADVEEITGISRSDLRPDLFSFVSMEELDQTDIARAQEYALLAVLLWRAPETKMLAELGRLKGNASPIGMAHLDLSLAAAETDSSKVQQEFFQLFIGLGRGELVPYASFYLTGFLHEKPLARVRADLSTLGLERETRVSEPEDHIAVLCEVMSGLIRGEFATDGDRSNTIRSNTITDRQFFERHLSRWALRFFADLEAASEASFYRKVGALGRVFMEIETEAFSLPA